MRGILRVAPYILALAFALWCGFALRGDLAQLSPAVLLRAWPIVVSATLLSLLNYALRVVRWRFYLARLGPPSPSGSPRKRTPPASRTPSRRGKSER